GVRRARRICLVFATSPMFISKIGITDCPLRVMVDLLPRHLENDFQLDRGAEWKACDAIHQAARALVFSEDVLQQLRSGISDFRLIADISRSGHRHAEPDDPRHSVERSQMLPRDSED